MYILKFPHHFPFWRRYDFLRSMTKSQISISCIEKPVVATYGVQNYKIALDIIVYIFILQAAECDHAATNSVILYKTKSHTYIHIHLVIFTTYKTFTIYKSTHHCAFPKKVASGYIPTPYLTIIFQRTPPTTVCS